MAAVRIRGNRTSRITKGKVGFISAANVPPQTFDHSTLTTSAGAMEINPIPVARIIARVKIRARESRVSGGLADMNFNHKMGNRRTKEGLAHNGVCRSLR
jgi:hypothetical protein